MEIHDITHNMNVYLPLWPGDPPFQLIQSQSEKNGEPIHLAQVHFSVHMGTHVDAPRHFFQNGQDVSRLSLEKLIGKATVVEYPGKEAISADFVKSILKDREDVHRLLFKTINSELWRRPGFQKSFVAISPEASDILLEHDIWLVGIDYMSIEAFHNQEGFVHKNLLKHGVIVLEGLDLENVLPGDYELIALPLKIDQADGSPVRAILRTLPEYDNL